MWDLESCAPLIWNRVHRSPTDFEYSGCTLFAGFSVVYPLNTLCVNGTRCPGRAAVARAATAAPAPALAPLCLIALVGTCVAVHACNLKRVRCARHCIQLTTGTAHCFCAWLPCLLLFVCGRALVSIPPTPQRHGHNHAATPRLSSQKPNVHARRIPAPITTTRSHHGGVAYGWGDQPSILDASRLYAEGVSRNYEQVESRFETAT